ncbi:MAG TPA: hypothetical protein VJ792_01580 [Candidatus Nitrosotalea sp.]|nr:hypothetical protein [Candidatus Nitrosotalea sp.]
MEHTYYSDGNKKEIAWTIVTDDAMVDQVRTHIEDYYGKISIEQSKYVALHVGIFWGIGRFIIRNGDTVNIMLDLKTMFDNLAENKKPDDPFVSHRTRFIRQLIDQRNLTVRYQMIEPGHNKSSRLLS